MSNIMKLIHDNQSMESEICSLYVRIKKLRSSIKNNERAIYWGCEHKWSYDSSGGPYDKIKYRCNICGLWRCKSMYM